MKNTQSLIQEEESNQNPEKKRDQKAKIKKRKNLKTGGAIIEHNNGGKSLILKYRKNRILEELTRNE